MHTHVARAANRRCACPSCPELPHTPEMPPSIGVGAQTKLEVVGRKQPEEMAKKPTRKKPKPKPQETQETQPRRGESSEAAIIIRGGDNAGVMSSCHN